jgi:hypothetical protein
MHHPSDFPPHNENNVWGGSHVSAKSAMHMYARAVNWTWKKKKKKSLPRALGDRLVLIGRGKEQSNQNTLKRNIELTTISPLPPRNCIECTAHGESK